MAEGVMATTENMPYNLSTGGSSELKYKLDQRYGPKDGGCSPYGKQYSPVPTQNMSPGPPRISPRPLEYTEMSPVADNQDRTYSRSSSEDEDEGDYQHDRSVSEYADEGNMAAMQLTANGMDESNLPPPHLSISNMDRASMHAPATYNERHETGTGTSEMPESVMDTDGMSEGNIAAMALTNEEHLDPRANGISSEVSPTQQQIDESKQDETNGEALNYSSDGNVYTQLGGPPTDDRHQQLITIDPSYLNAPVSEHSDRGTSHSVLSAALRSGYTVQNYAHFTPNQVTHANFDNAGHLLPQADVEAFFSDMERPMATSVSMSGMYSTGTGHFTTLTNPPGLSLAQTYHAQTGNGRLIALQPPSYSDTQADYGLTQLYASRQGAVPPQYLGTDQGSSSSPTPHANTSWATSGEETLYPATASSHAIGNQGQKYAYPPLSTDSPVPRDESQIAGQYSRTSGLAGASSYSGYLSQDLNTTGWYQNVSSPYSDVRPSGKFEFY